MTLQAITLDLDDTLWPMAPTLHRAEAAMQAWLAHHAPATVAAHDLSALRRETIRRALLAAGDDPALAATAFEVFFAERQRVDLFDDVLPALARLAGRWPIVALSNGNADVQRVPGLGLHFHAALSARDLGLAKPAPAAYIAACARAGADPAATLHVGDDAALDVDGALAAGLQAAWVRRPGAPDTGAPTRPPQHVVATLAELADRLGA